MTFYFSPFVKELMMKLGDGKVNVSIIYRTTKETRRDAVLNSPQKQIRKRGITGRDSFGDVGHLRLSDAHIPQEAFLSTTQVPSLQSLRRGHFHRPPTDNTSWRNTRWTMSFHTFFRLHIGKCFHMKKPLENWFIYSIFWCCCLAWFYSILYLHSKNQFYNLTYFSMFCYCIFF